MARTIRPPRTGAHAQVSAHRSELKELRRQLNRRDRHDARAQIRRDPDGVELRQARGRALWLAT